MSQPIIADTKPVVLDLEPGDYYSNFHLHRLQSKRKILPTLPTLTQPRF